MVASSSGNVTTTSEVVFEYTDFFDTSGDVAAPYFQQTLYTGCSLISPAIVSRAARRILSAKLYCLPRFSLDSTSSSVLFLTTVPVKASTAASAGQAGNVQNTLIVPKADASWIKVGEWKASKLFAESNVQPAINTGGYMALFSGVVLNPDTMDISGVQMQCKIVVRFSEPLPAASTLSILHSNLVNVDSMYEVMTTNGSNKVVLLSAKGISSSV